MNINKIKRFLLSYCVAIGLGLYVPGVFAMSAAESAEQDLRAQGEHGAMDIANAIVNKGIMFATLKVFDQKNVDAWHAAQKISSDQVYIIKDNAYRLLDIPSVSDKLFLGVPGYFSHKIKMLENMARIAASMSSGRGVAEKTRRYLGVVNLIVGLEKHKAKIEQIMAQKPVLPKAFFKNIPENSAKYKQWLERCCSKRDFPTKQSHIKEISEDKLQEMLLARGETDVNVLFDLNKVRRHRFKKLFTIKKECLGYLKELEDCRLGEWVLPDISPFEQEDLGLTLEKTSCLDPVTKRLKPAKGQDILESHLQNLEGNLYELEAATVAHCKGEKIAAFGPVVRLFFNARDPIDLHGLAKNNVGNGSPLIYVQQEIDVVADQIIECKNIRNGALGEYKDCFEKKKAFLSLIEDAVDCEVVMEDGQLSIDDIKNKLLIGYIKYMQDRAGRISPEKIMATVSRLEPHQEAERLTPKEIEEMQNLLNFGRDIGRDDIREQFLGMPIPIVDQVEQLQHFSFNISKIEEIPSIMQIKELKQHIDKQGAERFSLRVVAPAHLQSIVATYLGFFGIKQSEGRARGHKRSRSVDYTPLQERQDSSIEEIAKRGKLEALRKPMWLKELLFADPANIKKFGSPQKRKISSSPKKKEREDSDKRRKKTPIKQKVLSSPTKGARGQLLDLRLDDETSDHEHDSTDALPVKRKLF